MMRFSSRRSNNANQFSGEILFFSAPSNKLLSLKTKTFVGNLTNFG
ncbi:hypothetical protein LINGRAHAP2_LOCUS11026, partial [Linum grandiflorum]